jgi:hypothetical protein
MFLLKTAAGQCPSATGWAIDIFAAFETVSIRPTTLSARSTRDVYAFSTFAIGSTDGRR